MSITALVVIGFVAALFLGNLLGAKPNQAQVVLDDFRMQARNMGVLVEVGQAPAWLASQAPLAKYSYVNDDWRHPKTYYIAKQGRWEKVGTEEGGLHGQIIALPSQIITYIEGLAIQANSVTLFWCDEDFVKNPAHAIVLEDLVAALNRLGAKQYG